MSKRHEDKGKTLTLHFGNIVQFLEAPLVKAMNVTNLISNGVGLLNRFSDGSSAFSELNIMGTNLPAATLEKLFGIPKGLRRLRWHRHALLCWNRLTVPNGPPERCEAAHASGLTKALRPLRNTLEQLNLQIVEQYRCHHHNMEALDLTSFRNLRRLNDCTRVVAHERQQQLRHLHCPFRIRGVLICRRFTAKIIRAIVVLRHPTEE